MCRLLLACSLFFALVLVSPSLPLIPSSSCTSPFIFLPDLIFRRYNANWDPADSVALDSDDEGEREVVIVLVAGEKKKGSVWGNEAFAACRLAL